MNSRAADPGSESLDQPIEARDYQASLRNPHDDAEIVFTVMQPALAAGERAPLVLHGHGFGGARLTGRDQRTVYEALSGGTLPSTEAARRAAHAGYFVISFDQRGFGQSGGNVGIMDPSREGADISALLDWAEQSMRGRAHLAYRDEVLLVGALGLSYGGGFQMLGACVDKRFAAIVPTATWHDLRYSLAPDNVVKTVWGSALVALGMPASGIDLDPVMYHALLQGLLSPFTGRGVSDAVAQRLYEHSPIAFFDTFEASHERPASPRVDALIIQGAGDTLFNMNEALANMQALQRAGNDVHLVIMRHGHSLPFLEDAQRIGFQGESTLISSGQSLETAAVELAYLDWRLRDGDALDDLPPVLIVLDDDTHLPLDELPRATERDLGFSGRAATGGLDLLTAMLREDTLGGIWQLVTQTVGNVSTLIGRVFSSRQTQSENDTALLARLVNALPAEQLDELASGGTFLPLIEVDDDCTAIAGIPTIEITVTGGGPSPIVFVGLGVQKAGKATTELLNGQIRPIRSQGLRRLDLNGVAARLSRGDSLGLLVYGYHPQFLASFSAIPGHIDVEGWIGLPLIELPD